MHAYACRHNVLYSGKLSREKTSVNFVVLWLFAKVFSAKFGDVASFGTAKANNLQKVFSTKIIFFTNSWKFSPSKVSTYCMWGLVLTETCPAQEMTLHNIWVSWKFIIVSVFEDDCWVGPPSSWPCRALLPLPTSLLGMWWERELSRSGRSRSQGKEQSNPLMWTTGDQKLSRLASF